ncbi:Protein LIGHT-DEPENDENT SHORT HYPOCOTYLS 5 [Acropora cervicornis]|uniref:Protein LIGHT-DEPENDENT SHORT HYPOCOTYLS 5 n=1 Tax=Acropora cervicornis TaxID=6130 RepID=A0AAD9Q7P9_ACRCE|nr:Protein LIGHT-DEPENDENT SHORT HYPOCOTYLS 5 [Acropora cervicornis]
MAQVPIAPLAADIQAVLQDPPAQPDAQPDAPAVQPAALQADVPQPPPGNQLAVVQPAAEVPAQGAAQPADLPELVATGVTSLKFCSSIYGANGVTLPFPCHPEDLQSLSSKVDTLQKQLAANSVEHALATVRQLAGRPSPLIDNHSLLAALEQLADVARQTGHVEKKNYDAIFRQCKPLLRDGRLASVVTRLLGDPEEKQVASQIQKILKSATAQSASPSRPPRYPCPPTGFGYPRPLLHSARDRGLSDRSLPTSAPRRVIFIRRMLSLGPGASIGLTGKIQRPRIWRPAAPCPDCAYLNDETYNFCQRCGFRKELVSAQPVDPSAIYLDGINNRLSQLAKNKLSKPYEKQKSSLHRELLSVLASLPTPKTLHSATPGDILKFLVWKDKAGKTKVYQTQCPRRSSDKTPSCSCPTRLAADTVDSMIGKLRAIFTDAGLGGEWDDRLGIGNPVSHPSIKQYLKSVKEEQARAQ